MDGGIASVVAATISAATAIIVVILTSNLNKKIGEMTSKIQSIDSKKNRVSTYISDSRIEWMQKLKTYVVDYLDEVNNYILDDYKHYFKHHQSIQHKTNQIRLHLNYIGKSDKNILSEIAYLNRLLEIYSMKDDIEKIEFGENGERTLDKLRILEKYYSFAEGVALIVPQKLWEALKENSGDIREDLRSIYDSEISNYEEAVILIQQLIVLYTQVYLKTEWDRVKYEIDNGSEKDYDFDGKYEENLKKVEYEIKEIKDFLKKSLKDKVTI